VSAQYRRYFPRSLAGAQAVRRIVTGFAQNWFCGAELEEIEAALALAVEDALLDGGGEVIVLTLDAGRDGLSVQVQDRAGQGFTRIFRRFGQVNLAREA
jgi:hypothetical protein